VIFSKEFVEIWGLENGRKTQIFRHFEKKNHQCWLNLARRKKC
jgi:hypothetical protein